MAILESSHYNLEQSSPARADKPGQPANQQLWLVGAVLFFAWVVLKSAWLSDDAFITLRTVRNAVEGYGLVWNVGERVQAYTHPLWMLLLTLSYFVTKDAYYGTIFISMLVAVSTAALLVWRVARSFTAALLAVLLCSLSKALIDYSTSGLENPLTHLLLALFVWLYWRAELTPQRRYLGLALVTALTLINRMDVALIIAPAFLLALWQARRERALMMIAGGLLPFVAWELFALLYYGFPLPNTAYAKLGVNMGVGELLQQGIYYLLNSLVVDPITLLTVALALSYTALRRQWRLLSLAVGIGLYLGYVVWIGGDFMSGRFLSAPFCAAVLLLAQADYPALWQPQSWLLAVVITLVGLLNPTQAPWLSGADYNVNAIDSKGIADERGHYYQRYGLLVANRANRLALQSTVVGTPEPADFIHCGIGVRGFQASPYTHLVDFCGLADALIARLPTVYDPNWRIGHPIRTVPLGYMGTIRTGQNLLVDPNLAQYYAKLRLITQGELWDTARLREIWNFNWGKYDALIDEERYRYPDIKTLRVEAPAQTGLVVGSLFGTEEVTLELNNQGVRIDLGETYHATQLEVGLDCEYCTVVFFAQGAVVGQTRIAAAPLQLGPQLYALVTVPDTAVAQGYDQVRITPIVGFTYTFTYLNLLDLRQLGAGPLTATELPSLLRCYYHTFYRSAEPERTQLLAQLRQPFSQLTENTLWQKVPLKALLALLAMPDPALQPLIEPLLPINLPLQDSSGQTPLRYLGITDSATVASEGKLYLQPHLHFLVVTPLEQEYTAWFHIQTTDAADDGEWMLYDYFPAPPMRQWQPGTVVEFAPQIELAPGQYTLAFGFWTPNVRERLYVDPAADVYSIDLGEFTVEE